MQQKPEIKSLPRTILSRCRNIFVSPKSRCDTVGRNNIYITDCVRVSRGEGAHLDIAKLFAFPSDDGPLYLPPTARNKTDVVPRIVLRIRKTHARLYTYIRAYIHLLSFRVANVGIVYAGERRLLSKARLPIWKTSSRSGTESRQ